MDIVIDNISKSFNDCKVIEDFSLKLPDKGIVCFLGESGSGKTTLLNIIANVIQPDEGRIIGIEKKTVAYVFQEDRLIPWISVKENLGIVLNKSQKNKDTICLNWLKKVLLEDHYNKLPSSLSGGMKRRVSMARALCYNPDILLLDEPFNGLDEHTKTTIMNLIKKQSKNSLIILVTHNKDEVKFLGDFIYILEYPPLIIKRKIDTSKTQICGGFSGL